MFCFSKFFSFQYSIIFVQTILIQCSVHLWDTSRRNFGQGWDTFGGWSPFGFAHGEDLDYGKFFDPNVVCSSRVEPSRAFHLDTGTQISHVILFSVRSRKILNIDVFMEVCKRKKHSLWFSVIKKTLNLYPRFDLIQLSKMAESIIYFNWEKLGRPNKNIIDLSKFRTPQLHLGSF